MASKLFKNSYIAVDENNIQGIGMCDRSGRMFYRKDLRKQMEWRGDSLGWIGLIVGVPYLDEPNSQLRPPPIKDDPISIKDPRPPYPYFDPSAPDITPYPEIIEKLEEDSFHDIPNPSFGTPNQIPGWPNDFDQPTYQQIVAKLNKVTFQ